MSNNTKLNSTDYSHDTVQQCTLECLNSSIDVEIELDSTCANYILSFSHNCPNTRLVVNLKTTEIDCEDFAYTMNELSKRYRIKITRGFEYLLEHITELTANDNLINIDTFGKLFYKHCCPSTDTVIKISNVFFSNINNAKDIYVQHILNIIKNRQFMNNDDAQMNELVYLVGSTSLFGDITKLEMRIIAQSFMNNIEKFDIPYSKKTILITIEMNIEIPHVHKYGYDMNDPEFIEQYTKYKFHPERYNIDESLIKN